MEERLASSPSTVQMVEFGSMGSSKARKRLGKLTVQLAVLRRSPIKEESELAKSESNHCPLLNRAKNPKPISRILFIIIERPFLNG